MDLESLPEVRTIPVDRDMAKIMAYALSVYQHETCDESETVKRIYRVLEATYPGSTVGSFQEE